RVAEPGDEARPTVADENHAGAGALEVGPRGEQLGDVSAAVDAAEMADEHEHDRPLAPQRAELDENAVLVLHRHAGEVHARLAASTARAASSGSSQICRSFKSASAMLALASTVSWIQLTSPLQYALPNSTTGKCEILPVWISSIASNSSSSVP